MHRSEAEPFIRPDRSQPAREIEHLAWLVAGCVALLLTAVAPASPAAAGESVEAAPGSVLRWSAAGADRCALGDRSWLPLEGLCLYPIDLKASGEVTVKRRVGGSWQSRTIAIADYPYETQHITLEDDSRVHLSAENVARSRRESQRVGALWQSPSERRFTLPLAPPLAKLPPGGRFGSRRVFNGEPRNPHSGVDYAARRGTEVLATAAGEVVLAEEHFFAGKSVFIDHGDELVSMYFHLDSIAVEKGQSVGRGEVIGSVGSTGRSTGPHLHFGLRWHGARVDPTLLLAPVSELPELP